MIDAFVIRKPKDEAHVELLQRKLKGYQTRLRDKKEKTLFNPPEVNSKDQALAYLTYSVAILKHLLQEGEFNPDNVLEREFDSGLTNEEWFNGVYLREWFQLAVNNILIYSYDIEKLRSGLRSNE